MSGSARRRHWRGLYVVLAIVFVALAGLAVFAVLAVTSTASVTTDSVALARINLPLGGGTITRVTAVGGREQKLIPVQLRDGRLYPVSKLNVGEHVTVDVLVKRPGWLSWLTGSTQRVRLELVTPRSKLAQQYVTVRSGSPIPLHFDQPARLVQYANSSGRMITRVLASPSSSFSVPAPSAAGTLAVAAAPRTWEAPRTTYVSWFPPGRAATAVARPAPGSRIQPDTRITLTFSKPVAQALGSHMPPVSPDTSGTWHTVNSHTITFEPQGYGYGLGASVSIPLPSGVNLVGGQARGSDPVGRWSVPAGSTLRLQQILARLGYLPVDFAGKAVKPTLAAEVKAAVHPPSGTFNWRYPNTPGALRSQWAPGAAGVITRGAVMAFENDQGMTPDGVAGAQVWKALINADIKDQTTNFGYTYVMVSEGSPESETTWHNGKDVVSGAVNTGIAAAPTATGVYPVFEHLTVTTMTGTNPDGSHYSDPGIPWVSYFNGGDALHGFIRASYGFPQSLGCVEMPYSEAHTVFPYTPIGTLVDVS